MSPPATYNSSITLWDWMLPCVRAPHPPAASLRCPSSVQRGLFWHSYPPLRARPRDGHQGARNSKYSPTLGATGAPPVKLGVDCLGSWGLKVVGGRVVRQGSRARPALGALVFTVTQRRLCCHPFPPVLRWECAAESPGQLCLPTHQQHWQAGYDLCLGVHLLGAAFAGSPSCHL